VLELHGNMLEVVCVSCDTRAPMRATLDRIAAGEPDPPCLDCGGILKSGVVMFGEPLDERVIGEAAAYSQACDIFLAVGTSLRVHPAAGLCELAVKSGADLVIVNNEPTPYDGLATEAIREPISEALPRIVAALIPAA